MDECIEHWDWLYAQDAHYQSKWGMGQISRYLGSPVARIIGFAGGIFFAVVGGIFIYGVFK